MSGWRVYDELDAPAVKFKAVVVGVCLLGILAVVAVALIAQAVAS